MVIWLLTDNEEEALAELRFLRRGSEGTGWDMAKVSEMTNPPRTVHKYCVFRKTS